MNSHLFRTNFGLLIAALGLILLDPSPASSATMYNITDLGTLGGTVSYAFGVNIHGDVVGSLTTATGVTHAFLYHNGSMTDLGVLNASDNFSQASAVNDSGVVVGTSEQVGTKATAFYYSGGQMHFAGDLGGNFYDFGQGINNAGQVVGISANGNGVTHAYLAQNGIAADLGSLSSTYEYSNALKINDLGHVTGYSSTSSSGADAFLWTSAGGMQDLGNLGGVSRGFGINNSDHVTGASIIDSNGDEHSFLWHDGILSALGTTAGAITSQGLAINNLDEVVGTLVFDPSDGSQNHGFFYSNGVMTDLNNLLPANSGWVLRDAQSINDLGQIVGFGDIGGQQHAYLLTPVPEPSTVILFAVGLVGLVARRRMFSRREIQP